jgi:hypothetical protein
MWRWRRGTGGSNVTGSDDFNGHVRCWRIELVRSRLKFGAVPDELVAHIAPLGWEHIAFDGDYVWPSGPLQNVFRPLRNPRSEILDAA